ncbi:hypothetical protein LWI28_018153 [Acer negundo]|uniref:CCHC-type domain-containing protein n=1 Tax=Acer negundo TaxID=4023 RepID=A0AAD5NX40_ACENE|nr:hypothetical protein LWI28_018153 [Acer negundo]
MKAYIRSIDERAWMTMEEGYLSLNKSENGVTVSKPRSEWLTNEFELAKWHHRAPKAKNKGLALKVVKEASSSEDDDEIALLVRKFIKFLRKGVKPSGKYSRENKVKNSFTSPYERSGHAKSNRKVQCFKCKKLGHYALDCLIGDTKKDKKGKAMAATWSEDDDSSDRESSNDESSSEEELVSNFVAFMTSHSILEDICQDSFDKEVDPNHQECLSDNPTYVDLLAKVKCLEKDLKVALREVVEKDDLIKLQVDEFVSTTRRFLGEKNALAKKLR